MITKHVCGVIQLMMNLKRHIYERKKAVVNVMLVVQITSNIRSAESITPVSEEMQSILQYYKLRRQVQAELESTSSASRLHSGAVTATATTIESSQGPDKEASLVVDFRVTLEGNKEFSPREWPRHRKILYTTIALTTGIAGGWASSNVSAVLPQAREAFNVSEITESLATGLYLVGFGAGSLVSGPFSEAVGRNPVYLATTIVFILMLLGSALAQNIATQLACRFLAGIFGCTAVTTFASSTADMWKPSERGVVFSTSSTINFAGVFLAPVVGGWIGQSRSISWLWTEWIAIIVAGTSLLLVSLFLPETNVAILEHWRARHLRQLTGDTRYHCDRDARSTSLGAALLHSVYRPFEIIYHELTVVLFTAYLTVVYVVTFTFLTGFTFIYTDIYGFSQGFTNLCFLGLDVGIVLAGILAIPLQWKYVRDLSQAQQSGGTTLPPEKRLLLGVITAPTLPIGLFWMAWTARPSVSYWSSLGGTVLVGVSFEGLFVPVYLYLIDMFEEKAASALAISTVVRYVAAGASVPASIPLYRALGVEWTLTMLACISLVLTPLPFLFYRYGHRIRKRSRNATKSHT